MRGRTKRRIEHVLLVVLPITGLYATFYAGSLLLGSTIEDTSIVEHATTTLPGWAFLGSVGIWVAALGGWKLHAIRREFRRDPDAAHRDEVVTKLRDALDERE